MADKINQIEIGGITYDLQDKKSIFSGTAAEYEATADTIEDGTVVNITDDFVEGETLDAYVLNKVDELEDKIGSSVKTKEELMANGEEGKLADALAIKETIKYYSVIMPNIYCNSLEEFVEATAGPTRIIDLEALPAMGRFYDESGWGPNQRPNWYRFSIIYQNHYNIGVEFPVHGCGTFWDGDGASWNIFIDGNKATGLSIRYEKTNKPTITNRADLMANTVSGLFPDALAVKDGLNKTNEDIMNHIESTIYRNSISDIETDLNNTTRLFTYTDGNTLNTPYKEGKSNSKNMLVLTTNAQYSYSTQFAFSVGLKAIYTRSKAGDNWSNWFTYSGTMYHTLIDLTGWITCGSGSYIEGEKRYTKENMPRIKMILMTVGYNITNSNLSNAYVTEYLDISTPYEVINSGYYSANSSKGPIILYYDQTDRYIDVREVPSDISIRAIHVLIA